MGATAVAAFVLVFAIVPVAVRPDRLLLDGGRRRSTTATAADFLGGANLTSLAIG